MSTEEMSTVPRHIAYVSLQAVVDGQDTWAAVMEIIGGFEADGWTVDRYFSEYAGGAARGITARLVGIYRVQRRLARRLGEYDALYIRGHQLAWPIAKLAKRRGIPVIHECNGPYDDLYTAWPQTRLLGRMFEYLQRSQYRAADAVISVAEGLTRWLIEDTGNPNIFTNGNGANVVAFAPDAPRREGLPPRFAVFFGQFPAWQGITTLLEAVRSTDWPEELPLVFVGDGAMRHEVERAAADLPQRVIYLGRLPYLEVAGVVAHSLVSYVPMVAPERETMFSPLKLYESMSSGVPVIASDTIGISEVVNEFGCGILVEPGDAFGILRATRDLLADPVRSADMGRRGRAAAVERFSWRARSRQRRRVIEHAIESASKERVT